jgi:hypothetical protein
MFHAVKRLTISTVAAVALAACASDGTQTASDCFDANRIVGWETHDGRSLDVTDHRGDHYRVHFCNACRGLDDAISPQFEAGADGMMCGDADEEVRIRNTTCKVSSVMRVAPQAEELDADSCS